MISEKMARQFANDWIASWNAHDLDRVLSHYAENVEYLSAFVIRLTGNESGRLRGKEEVRAYLQKGLDAYPGLHFHLEHLFVGVASITLQYQSVNNLRAAEVFELNEDGQVIRVLCHYSPMA